MNINTNLTLEANQVLFFNTNNSSYIMNQARKDSLERDAKYYLDYFLSKEYLSQTQVAIYKDISLTLAFIARAELYEPEEYHWLEPIANKYNFELDQLLELLDTESIYDWFLQEHEYIKTFTATAYDICLAVCNRSIVWYQN